MKKIIVFDSYLMHKYEIIKYRSSSFFGENQPIIMGIMAEINQLFWELWPFFNLSFA